MFVIIVNLNILLVKGVKCVEVLCDGVVVIYGIDVILGVVNYVLDDKYIGGEV